MSGPILPASSPSAPDADLIDVPALRLAEWFRGATASALNGIYVFEPMAGADGSAVDFRFVFGNARGAELLGHAGQSLAGRTLREALPPSRVDIVVQQCRDVMASGQPIVEEFEVSEFAHGARWLRHQVVPIRDGVVITSENISLRKQAEGALARREEWFRAAADGNLNALFINEAVFDAAGELVDFVFAHVNEQGGRLVGMDPAAMIGRSICELFPVNRTHGYFERYRQVFLEQITVVDEFAIDSPTLKAQWLRQLAVPWSRGVALSAEDITDEVRRKEELLARQQMLMAFIEQIPGPAWIADAGGQARIYNQHYAQLAEAGTPEGGAPVPLEALFDAGRSQSTYDVFRFPIQAGGQPMAAGFALDVTARIRAEARAEYLTSHDDATGLLNREGFLQRLGRRTTAHTRSLVARISLREAETLRELLGSSMVDRLVRGYADRMLAGLAAHDAEVGRDGPDQLLVALGGGAGAEAALLAAWPELSREIELDGQRYSLNPRLGYAVAEGNADASSDGLLHASDLAHGQAVTRQTTAATAFEPGMAERLRRRVEIQRELGTAVLGDELSLVLQPVFADGAPGVVVGLESLVRWTSPRLGLVSPGEFIPIAEESSAIVALGDWVLEQSCRELRRLDEEGEAGLYIAVNVAEAQLARGDFNARITQLLARHGLPPHRLELEITERTLMADTAVHQANLRELRAAGVRLSVDDFGTGYSSLSYLLRFAVDKIKIDRSFIAGLGVHASHEALVRTLVALADSLGLDCVSEGVETQDQLDRLRVLGCGLFQGYLLARPMAPELLRSWLAGRRTATR